MKTLALILLTLLLLVFETRVLPPSAGLPARPDLVVLLVLLWGLMLGPQQAMVAVGIGGLLTDFASAAPLGAHVLALLPIVPLSLLRELELVESRFVLGLLLTPVVTALYYGIVIVILQLGGWPVDWPGSFTWVIAPACLMNCLVIPLFYVLVAPVLRRLSGAYAGTVVRHPL